MGVDVWAMLSMTEDVGVARGTGRDTNATYGRVTWSDVPTTYGGGVANRRDHKIRLKHGFQVIGR
jgi:hypothetical protein